VRVRTVTCYPGSVEQVQFVRDVIYACMGPVSGILVGASGKVGKFITPTYHENFGVKRVTELLPPDGSPDQVMLHALQQWPDATILCGAPLGNLHALLLRSEEKFQIRRIVVQGGFAGTRCGVR
jgi:hypothetical protein